MSKTYSCSITIDNAQYQDLTIVASTPTSGTWASNPPSSVPAGQYIELTLEDDTDGCEAVLQLQSGASTSPDITLTMACTKKGNQLEYTHTGPNCSIYFTSPDAKKTNQVPDGRALTATFWICHRIPAVYAIAYACVPILNLAGSPVDPSVPIWTPIATINDGTNHSNYPAAFPTVASGSTAPPWLRFTVVWDYDSMGTGEYTVSAVIPNTNTQLFSAVTIQPNDSNGCTVELSPADGTTAQQFNGDLEIMVTTLASDGNSFSVTVNLELYWLFDKPSALWDGGGVWVSVLRDIFSALAADTTQPPTLTSAIGTITQGCFDGFNKSCPKQYDVKYASSYYCQGYFALADYYQDTPLRTIQEGSPLDAVNCVDMSNFLYICLDAVGIRSWLVFSNGFGCFAQNGLIGWGKTNNPIFKNINNTPLQICDEMDPRRSWWPEHDFVLVPSAATTSTGASGNTQITGNMTDMTATCNIADACGGPHLGTESVAAYYQSAIDTVGPYGQPGNLGPGVPSDLQSNYQPYSITAPSPPSTASVSTSLAAPAPAASAPASFTAAAAAQAFDGRIANANTPALLASAAQAGGFVQKASSTATGPSSAVYRATWEHAGSGAHLRSRLFVEHAGGAAAAAARFAGHLKDMTVPQPDRTLQPGPSALGPVSLVSNAADVVMVLWQHRNVFGVFTSDAPLATVTAFVEAVQAGLEAAAVDADKVDAPKLSPLVVEPASVSVGQEVTIRPQTTIGSRVAFRVDQAVLRLVRRTDESLTFRALAAGDTTVTLMAAHPTTLLADQAAVVVQVSAAVPSAAAATAGHPLTAQGEAT